MNILNKVIAALLFAVLAHGNMPSAYVEGSASLASVDSDGVYLNKVIEGDTVSQTGLAAGVELFRGHNFTFGAEARMDFGKVDGIDVQHTFWFARAEYLFGCQDIGAYGLLGYGNSSLSIDTWAGDVYGFSYGAGARYIISDRVSFFSEYVRPPSFKIDKSSIDFNKMNFGIRYDF